LLQNSANSGLRFDNRFFIFTISISGCFLSCFLQLFIKTLLITLTFLCCKHRQTTVGLSSFALISNVNHIFINQADSQKINLCIWQGLQQSHGSGLEKSGSIFSFSQGCLKVIFLIVSWAGKFFPALHANVGSEDYTLGH